MESLDKEDLFNSVKKYINTSDETAMSAMVFDDSGAKARNTQARKLVDGFSLFDELERLLEEQDESMEHLDPQLMADLTTKVNVGKAIQGEVAELILSVCMRQGMTTATECKRINEMQQQLTQNKLKMPIEQSQLSFIQLLREFFEKLMRALKMPCDNSKNTFDKNMQYIETNIFLEDTLGESLDLEQLNSLYVDLLSILDIVSKQPESSKRIMSSLAKSLEDTFTQAIWINKASDLKNSDQLMMNQIPFQKFNEFLRQVPRDNSKALLLAEQLEAMKEKHGEYLVAFKDVENQLDEKKLTLLSSEQLKVLQVKLQAISRVYKAVPYALKLDLKQKQQQIERIVDNIEWSISAKGILEERVESIQQLEKILIEQTQKELSASQKLLIKDIQERIFAVKKSNTQLAQVNEIVSQVGNYNAPAKKFHVQLFIDLFDTYKDLNQYINLDAQLAQVEDFLKVYQDEEFSLLKLSKGWMNRINEEKLELKQFRADMDSIKSLLKKSIFDWTKYEPNIRGLDLVLRVREILQTAENQSAAATSENSQQKEENILLLLGWKSVIDLKEEIQLLESKDNYVLKSFEGKAILMRKIDEYLSVKSDLDNIGKRLLPVDRIDEMWRILNSTFINCPSEKQRLSKLRSMKEKVLNEMREFEAISTRKEKVSLARVQEVLDLIKSSSIKMDEKKVQLERKIHIAQQLIRMAKNTNHMDIERLVEQYHTQTVDIDAIEDIIRENKQVDKELDDFDVKLSYCADDYEDLMELNQILANVKPHFSRKRLLVLLQQKIFTLLTIVIWKQWQQKRPLFGFSFNSLKQILTQSEIYDEHIIINKNKVVELGIFEHTMKVQDKKQKQKQQNEVQKQQQIEDESLRRIMEESANEAAANKNGEDQIYLEEDDMEDLLKGTAAAAEEIVEQEEDKVFLQEENEQVAAAHVEHAIVDADGVEEPAVIPVAVDEEPKSSDAADAADKIEAEEEESSAEMAIEEEILESSEDKMKRTQQQIIEERFEVDVSILKECRNAVRQLWDQMMAKVRLIRSIGTMADIEDFELYPSKYAVGCVDLMDILIEQKILVQNRDAVIREQYDSRRKMEEEQAAFKEKQLLAAIINLPQPTKGLQYEQTQKVKQQQQQQQLQQQQQQQQQQQVGTTAPIQVITGASATLQSSDALDFVIERMMGKASMRGFSDKHKNIARTIARSMATNPHYKDMHVDLIENTVQYVVRRIIQFRYSDSYVEEMLELYEELKNDFYSSESYRKDSFSFKSFNTMMKFQHAKLRDNVLQKKRKMNEESNREEQLLLQQQQQLLHHSQQQNGGFAGADGGEIQEKESEAQRIARALNFLGGNRSGGSSGSAGSMKKIIDHNEYMNLDFKFSNTQMKDPLIKELHRLMQSKETLVQFRKLQADLNRITGNELKQDTKITRGMEEEDDEEEEEEDENGTIAAGKRSKSSVTGKSSVSSNVKEQFSSDDEDETEQEIIQSHPSVIKYMREQKVKKLIDPIQETEMDAFMEFCNSQLKQLYSNQNLPQMRIMYNPLTNDQELIHENPTGGAEGAGATTGLGKAKKNHHHHHHHGQSIYDAETDGAGQQTGQQVYDPAESLKIVKNIYSLFEGKIHLRADTTVPQIEVTCFVETQESAIKDCPVFHSKSEEQVIVQSGESEMLETKEYLIKSYQCETILSLFGSVESTTEEGQTTLDSLAQDLKNRDRVSIAQWNTATKMYVFHKKVFERDHCNNRLSKKFALSSSELCFALIFKPVGLKQEQIDAIERIKEPKLYSQSPDDFLELQAIKMAQKRETQEFKEARAALFAEGQQNKQPKFKKPLPKYRKDTLLKIYLPIKGGQEGDHSDDAYGQQEGNNLLNILLKPSRTVKEVERKLEEMNSNGKSSVTLQSFFRKPSTVKNSAHKEAERDVKAFFERRLNGKRTVKHSLNKLDMIRLRKLPEQTQAEIEAQLAMREEQGEMGMPIEGEDIFANLTGQIDNLQTTINKSMAKKSVTYSDQVQKYPAATSSSDTFSQQESFDYDGINDYSDETSAFADLTMNGGDTDDSVSPLREPEKPSTQAKSLSSFKKSAGKSILRTSSRFGQPTPSSLKLSSQSQDMQLEDFSQDDDESSLLNSEYPNMYRSSGIEGSEDSSDDTTPKYSNTSVSSLSQTSIAKNRQKLLEFASILDQIKPSALKSVASLNKLSEMSKISSINPNTTFNSISKQPINSSSMEEEYEDFSSSYSPAASSSLNQKSSLTNSQQKQSNHIVNLQRFRNNNNNNGGTSSTSSDQLSQSSQQQQPQQRQFIGQRMMGTKPPQPGMMQFQKGKPDTMNSGKSSGGQMDQQYPFQRMFDNKENKPNMHHRPRPSPDADGLLTPQLSLSKESYSKGSVESNTSYSGKRSFNTAFPKNSVSSSGSMDSSNLSSFNPYGATSSSHMPQSSNPTNSKFSVSSYHSRQSDYSELTEDDEQRYEKTTPVIDKFMHNTFRSGGSSVGPQQKQFRGFPQQQQQRQMNQPQRPMMGGQQQQQQQFFSQQRPGQQQQFLDQNNRNMNKQSSAFIYEQDNYQYNSKTFNKSISKNTRTPMSYTESDSEVSSSSTSKVNENQLLDLRDQLDSLLSAIQHKKSTLHIQ